MRHAFSTCRDSMSLLFNICQIGTNDPVYNVNRGCPVHVINRGSASNNDSRSRTGLTGCTLHLHPGYISLQGSSNISIRYIFQGLGRSFVIDDVTFSLACVPKPTTTTSFTRIREGFILTFNTFWAGVSLKSRGSYPRKENSKVGSFSVNSST